jgi:hypothetical protein
MTFGIECTFQESSTHEWVGFKGLRKTYFLSSFYFADVDLYSSHSHCLAELGAG